VLSEAKEAPVRPMVLAMAFSLAEELSPLLRPAVHKSFDPFCATEFLDGAQRWATGEHNLMGLLITTDIGVPGG